MTAWRSQNFRFVSIGKLNWSFKCACLLYANLLKWLVVYWNESKLMEVFFKVFLTRPNKDKMLATSAKRQGRWTQDCRLSFVFEFEIWWNEMQIFGRFEWKKKQKFLFKFWGCLEKRNFVFQFCCQEKKAKRGKLVPVPQTSAAPPTHCLGGRLLLLLAVWCLFSGPTAAASLALAHLRRKWLFDLVRRVREALNFFSGNFSPNFSNDGNSVLEILFNLIFFYF